MKASRSLLLALCCTAWVARPGHADSNGDQPETPPSMNRQPVAPAVKATQPGVLPKLEVEFQTNHWDIPPTYAPSFDAFGAYLHDHAGSKASVVAYADHTGHGPANVELSKKRADAVAKYIVDHYAIAADRITAEGYGEVSDKQHNITASDKQANRRAIATIVNP